MKPWVCKECGRHLRNQNHADGCSRLREPDEVELMESGDALDLKEAGR